MQQQLIKPTTIIRLNPWSDTADMVCQPYEIMPVVFRALGGQDFMAEIKAEFSCFTNRKLAFWIGNRKKAQKNTFEVTLSPLWAVPVYEYKKGVTKKSLESKHAFKFNLRTYHFEPPGQISWESIDENKPCEIVTRIVKYL